MKHVWAEYDLRNGILITRFPNNGHNPVYMLVKGRRRGVGLAEYEEHKKIIKDKETSMCFNTAAFRDDDDWKFHEYFVIKVGSQPTMLEWGDGSPQGIVDYLNADGRFIYLDSKRAGIVDY